MYIIGKPCSYPKYQAKQKVTRVDSTFAYHLQPINDGVDTQVTFICEFDFKGSIPRRILMNAAPVPYTENLKNLKFICQELSKKRKA